MCKCNRFVIGLLEVLPSYKYLRVLEIVRCAAVTNDVLKVIADNCTYITEIDLSACENVGDYGLEALAELGNLTNIGLTGTQVRVLQCMAASMSICSVATLLVIE